MCSVPIQQEYYILDQLRWLKTWYMYVEVARLCLLDWQQKRRVALGFPPLWQGIAWEPPKGQAVPRGKRPWGTAWPWPYGPPNAIPSYRGGNPSAQTLLLSLSVSFLQWAEFPTMWFLSGDQEIRYILCCSDYLTCPDIGRRKKSWLLAHLTEIKWRGGFLFLPF